MSTMLRALPLIFLSGCSLLTALSEPTNSGDSTDADASPITDAAPFEASDASDAEIDAAHAPIAFVQSASSATTSSLALPHPVTNGSLLIAAISTNDTGTVPVTGVSDTLNGVWKKAVSAAYADGHVELYYLSNSLAGTDTVTSAPSGQAAMVVAEYSGVATTSPLDQFIGASGSNSATLETDPTAALMQTHELVIGVGGETAAVKDFVAGSGFVMRDQAALAFDFQVALEDRIATTTSGAVMTMMGSQNDWGALVAVFKTP